MRRIDIDTATDRKYPERVHLPVVPDRDGASLVPACWCVSPSHDPPMLAVRVGEDRDTQNWVRLDENGGAATNGVESPGEEQEG